MSGWTAAPLGTVCDVVGGGTPSRNTPEFFGGAIPWITPSDVTRNKGRYLGRGAETITELGLQNSSAKLLPPRSVLLTSRATIGFTAINKVPVTTNQGFASFVCGPKVWPEFLAYWLEWSRDRLMDLASGATFKEINKSVLRKLPIPLPPLDEQQRIVGLLDRAAEIRHRAEAARAKARAIIPALFLNTFGDPATNHKGWPIEILGDHADVQGGVQVSAKRATSPVELPYLRVANVMRGNLSLSEIKTICVTSAEAKRTSLVQGDILIVEGHGNPNEIGRAAIWDGSIPGCVHQNHLIRVRPYQTHLRSEYVETFLNSDVGRRILIQDGKTTSGLNTISTRNVKNVAVLLAPIDLQSAFTVQVRRVGEVARLLDTAAVKAEAMAAALSAEVFGSPPHGSNAGQDAYGH